MEKAKLMQLEIEQKRKLPKNVKDKISTKIFQNLLVAVIIMAYFCVVNISYYKLESNKFEEYLKYFALGISVITVIAFEFSYRKNSLSMMIIGIELLLCGILSLYIPYVFLHTNATFRISIMILPIVLVIYYAIKSFILFKKNQLNYRNNLSDVKEIVKETEKSSYIEEESSKTYRAKKAEEKIIREKISNDQKKRRKLKNQKLKEEQISKLKEMNKKIDTKTNNKTNNKNNTKINTKNKSKGE